jgi:hypothetical protein
LRKLVLLTAMLGSLTFVAAATASDPIIIAPVGGEGCVSPSGDTCTYTSTRDGGLVANGSNWTVTVEIPANGDPRDTNGDGSLRYVFSSANAPDQGCGFFGPGSKVTTNAGTDSQVAAGNPIPGQSDAVLGDANNCATGIVAADNPSYTPAD